MPIVTKRIPRQGRLNPGEKHLAGADIGPREQRQYEHILESLRQSHRYHSDRKRKQVAAATVRSMLRNPSMYASVLHGLGLDEESRARQLAEEFHGRPSRGVTEITEREVYDEHVAVLGYLIGLEILTEDGHYRYPIEWDYDRDGGPGNIELVSNPAGTNLEFIGGDQSFNWQAIEGATSEGKYLVYVGPVLAVSYYADKHHLTGPKSQKDGVEYRHEFGDEQGELPCLVYDRRNRKMLLVGGDYRVTPEGIAG
jgi:hypothetical protein